MKDTKKYILLITTSLLMAACSSEDLELAPTPTPNPADSTAITFGGAICEAEEQVMGTRHAAPLLSRAATVLEDIATTFHIWSYKNMTYDSGTGSYGSVQTVINDYTVNYGVSTAGTTASNTHDWEYVTGSQSIKYWDFSATAYRFFGYVPAAGVTAPVVSSSAVISTSEKVKLTVAVDASDQTNPKAPYISNLWFSNNDPDHTPYGSVVRMQFIQPFAKVRFKFIDREGNDFDNIAEPIDLSTISFKPTDGSAIATKGTFEIGYPIGGTATELEFEGLKTTAASMTAFTIPYVTTTATGLVSDVADLEKWYTVLPTTSQDTYTLSANIAEENKTAVVPAIYMRWLPGFTYTYIFKVGNTGLTFDSVQVGLRDWETVLTDDHPVYNW